MLNLMPATWEKGQGSWAAAHITFDKKQMEMFIFPKTRSWMANVWSLDVTYVTENKTVSVVSQPYEQPTKKKHSSTVLWENALTCNRDVALSMIASASAWRRLKSVDINTFDRAFLLWYVLISSTRSAMASWTSWIKMRSASPFVSSL